ncbi:MAG: hypothetical protein AAF242_00060 [Bacteroidota bacterium]
MVPDNIAARWTEKFGDDILDRFKAWKKKHGDVLVMETDEGLEFMMGQPDRKVVGLAMSRSRSNPLGLAEVLVKNCFLVGEEGIDKDSPGFLTGIMAEADNIIGTVTMKVKKY